MQDLLEPFIFGHPRRRHHSSVLVCFYEPQTLSMYAKSINLLSSNRIELNTFGDFHRKTLVVGVDPGFAEKSVIHYLHPSVQLSYIVQVHLQLDM